MELHESGEMYLETILVLSKQLPVVRAIDISEELEYSKPSVSRAIKLLVNDEYISLDKNKFITLTKKGQSVAEKIFDRHKVLTCALKSIGISEEIAAEDACKIEHVISDETFNKLKERFPECIK
jgi:Mn-dependent DtxR family transcriptional regulator